MSVRAVKLHYVDDGVLADWLVDELVSATYEPGLVLESLLGVGRAADEVGLSIAVCDQILVQHPDPAHELRPVHARHAEVREDNFEQSSISVVASLDRPDALLNFRQSLRAVIDLDAGYVRSLEDVVNEIKLERVVIDYENLLLASLWYRSC